MATLATASSKVTVATAPALASLTSTALTPETRNSVLFTIGPQSSQVALSTFSTTIFSAACTVQGESAIATVAAAARRRIMEHSFGLEVRDQRNRGASFGKPS